jgi:SpoIID/LytB domain protein
VCACCAVLAVHVPAVQGPGADAVRIGVLRDGSYDVVTLPLETYVARVLAGEALPGSEPAALEALAIAIRTYTVANLGKHRGDGFDLCDQTHCQVMRTATPATEQAAAATAGRILMYKGEPASIYYSASCGGRTEKPSHVWPGAEDVPYLPSRDDDGCGGSPQWTAVLSTGDLQRALNAAGFRGALREMRIASRNDSGRVQTLSLDGMTPGDISGQDLRAAAGRTLGWQRILSTAFELRRSGDAYRFTGHGSGHGVGMCVIGSTRLALRGESARDILTRYFPGTTIETFGPRLTRAAPDRPSPEPLPSAATAAKAEDPSAGQAGDVVVSLPEGDEGERTVIAALVRQQRDDLANALGVAAPGRIAVRFHETTNAYERASGKPWFTLASVARQEVHLVPLSTLRDRGVLERILRRQLVHLMIDAALAGRPAWVRDGAALYFSEPAPSAALRAACPSDVELAQPVSIGALGDAYARARACFEKQVRSGRSWQDVR